MKRLPVLPPDVMRVLERWHPQEWSDSDLRALEQVRDTVTEWVAKAAPRNPFVARRMLRTSAMLAVWAHQTWGTVDVATVLDPRNVEHWVMSVNSDRSAGWRENARGALRAVGRAAYPAGWPTPRQGGRQTVAVPYTQVEETWFVQTARLAGRSNRAARLWVVAGAFGGGLNGTEITAATIDDFEEIANGRLVVTTRGAKARMVPIRRAYTDLTREALEHCPADRLIRTAGRNIVYWISSELDTGDGEGLSLRRSRTTWLQAHLLAGTPLPALRRIAGPLSANTVDKLLIDAAAGLDNNTAVIEGLRA